MIKTNSIMMFPLATILLFAVVPFASAAPVADDHCGTIPHDYKPTPISTLPDPFTFINGDRVESKSDYRCRQREISRLIQQFELGTKPSDPDSMTSTFVNNTLAITVTDAGKTISFNVPITYPATGKAPYPAIIAVGGIYVKPAQPEGVAIINFNNDEMGAQASVSSRGQGLFYDLYGKDASAGAMVAWAWGVSRIIDALENTPSAKINTDYLGTTSCSRNGKGAFVVGALDDRIALTIPQESGTGGSGCWRVADANRAAGKNIQTADEFVQESVWAGPNFNTFTNNTAELPYDHHMLAGLVAPRGLLVLDNAIEWLGPISTDVCMGVGQLIYKALDSSDAMGYSEIGQHQHCNMPIEQQPLVQAFIDKFLFDKDTNTANIHQTTQNDTLTDWYKWKVPRLY